MTTFSESLTIRILGDSTHLERELEAVTQRISELQTRLSQFGELNQQIGRTVGQFSGMARPLEHVGRLLDRIVEQIRGLGRVPVTLNVAPALNSLGLLSAAIDAIAARLRALSVASLMPGGGVPMPGPRLLPGFGGGGPMRGLFPPNLPFPRQAGRGFAEESGGGAAPATERMPDGPAAGELVLRQSDVRQLSGAFLDALNRTFEPGPSAGRPAPPAAAQNHTHVNHFGGISIHVRRPADVNALIRDLRFQDFRLRNRRG